ncbi:CapA family protein, partial [Klebsiella pneumoniae]|nr:CapA family protein [Klebsiella pneumoniae]
MTKTYTLNFTGDVMLARLIDQLFPQHNYNERESNIISTFQTNYPHLFPGHYNHASPWGTALPLFQPPSSS